MIRRVTLLVDKQEKRPPLFPSRITVYPQPCMTPAARLKPVDFRVTVKGARLDAGDYTFKSPSGLVGIEKKGSLEELITNVATKDTPRFSRAIVRFAKAYTFPYLVLNFPLGELWRTSKVFPNRDKGLLMDRIFATSASLGLRLIVVGSKPSPLKDKRLRQGELYLRLMLQHFLHGENK